MLVATIVLAVLTGIYVILTGFITKEARRSSEAAGKAADAASRAANANTRSAVAAEISLEVDFDWEIIKIEFGLLLVLTFIGRSAVVNIFNVDVPKVTLGLEGDEEKILEFPETLLFDPLPSLLTRGQTITFGIVFESDAQQLTPVFALVKWRIEYGFDQTNPEAIYPFAYECLWQMPPPVREEIRMARRLGLDEAQPADQARRLGLDEAQPADQSRRLGLDEAQPPEEPGAAARPARRPKWVRWPW